MKGPFSGMTPEIHKRLFSLQQRLAITGGEALALLVLVGLIGAGGIAAHFQARPAPVDDSAYAEIDAALQAGARLSVDDIEEPSAVALDDRPAARAPRSGTPARLPPIRLDPNTASPQSLQRLPGIGPALAARIVEHRELHGPFRRPRDVTAVRGIGPKTFERLEPYLYVGSASSPDTVDAYSGRGPGTVSSGSSVAPSPDS